MYLASIKRDESGRNSVSFTTQRATLRFYETECFKEVQLIS
jgi:hypothetical protein